MQLAEFCIVVMQGEGRQTERGVGQPTTSSHIIWQWNVKKNSVKELCRHTKKKTSIAYSEGWAQGS